MNFDDQPLSSEGSEDGRAAYQVENGEAGPHIVSISARDDDGNEDGPRVYNIEIKDDVDTSPVIETSLRDGAAFAKDIYFTVMAFDHNGVLIDSYYYSVFLDGTLIYPQGTEGNASVYREYGLEAGEHDVSILATDTEGYSAVRNYAVSVTSEEQELSTQTVRLLVEADSLGFGILLDVSEQITENESAAHFISRILEKYSYTPDMNENNYLRRIYHPGIKPSVPVIPESLAEILKERTGSDGPYEDSDPDSLGERDYYATSGWIYLYNDVFMDVGLGAVTLADGDYIHLGFAPGGGSEYSGTWAVMEDWQ